MTEKSKEQYVKMLRSLLESDAYRGLGINGRRVLDFLELEHMRKGGKKNGDLKATYRQLTEFGVSGHVNDTITDLERRGLILCNRVYRVATTYTLTWLGLPGGKMPEQRWKTFHDPALHADRRRPKRGNLRAELHADRSKSASRIACRTPNLRAELHADGVKICEQNCSTYLEEISNQGEQYTRYREGPEPGAVVVELRPTAEGRR